MYEYDTVRNLGIVTMDGVNRAANVSDGRVLLGEIEVMAP
jgi:hypothetical protein